MTKFCDKCRYNVRLHKSKEPMGALICPDLPAIPDTEPMRVSETNARQVDGSHYNKMAIQHWDFIVANGLGYLEGCATKYIIRHKDKGGKKDLQKAIHYIEKMIETFYPEEKK